MGSNKNLSNLFRDVFYPLKTTLFGYILHKCVAVKPLLLRYLFK